MYRRSIFGLTTAMAFSLLCACGGGTGETSSSQGTSEKVAATNPEVAKPAALLSFAAVSLKANVQQGNSATLTVHAGSSDSAQFGGKLYAYIVDTAQVLMPYVQVVPIDTSSVSVTVHTRASLEAKHYQGVVKVQLCYDPECAMLMSGEAFDLPYDITVTENPLKAEAGMEANATVHRGGVVPNSVSVRVYNATQGWAATSSATWLKVINGTGRGLGNFTVIFEPQTLLEGHYDAVVTVKGVDGQVVDLPFTITVLPTDFVIKNNVPTFTAVNGAPISAQSLWVDLDNGMTSNWTATSSAKWMRVGAPSGGTPASVSVQPDPSIASLPSGTYSADIVLSSGSVSTSKTIAASLNLIKANFSASTATLNFGGTRGREWTGSNTLTFSLNTDTNVWPYKVTQVPDWLAPSITSGVVGQAGTSLDLASVPKYIKPGTTSSQLTITAQVNGDEVKLPVTTNVNADQRRLLASEWGIAFNDSPAGSILQRTIDIRDNFEQGLQWTASSDVPWLTVTSSGDTSKASQIALKANSTMLPLDAVSYANVTVKSATTGVDPAIIRVAVWRSANALTKILSVPAYNYKNFISDPIRPYIYALRGSIDIYNVHTGKLVATLDGPNGLNLEYLAVSTDGSKLFALTPDNLNIVVFDLTTVRYLKTWAINPAPYYGSATAIRTVRVNGVDMVFLNNGQAYVDGRLLDGRSGFVGNILFGASGGRRLIQAGVVTDVDFSEMNGGTIFHSDLRLISMMGLSANDFAISSDGSKLYGCGWTWQSGYQVNACVGANTLSGDTIAAINVDRPTTNVEVTRDGRLLRSVIAFDRTDDDLFIYTPDLKLLKSLRIASTIYDGAITQLAVTPDGFAGVALTQDPQLVFFPLQP